MQLETYSFGMGDRFGQQGQAQLAAIVEAQDQGIKVIPIWNKSFREHRIIGTCPEPVEGACPDYNLHLRQLLHVGYTIAARMGDSYLEILNKYQDTIAHNVKENILNRHILPVFG